MSIQNTIKQLSNDYFNEIVDCRRYLHQFPELSFEEFETAAFIQKKLFEFGITNVKTMANTGTVVLIEGKNPSKKTIALRADIDALPIVEQNNVPYKSKINGKMHACGHDVHTSCLLGVAKILNHLKNDFEGTLKLIFQPAEERLPGGASILIKEGVLKNPAPTHIIGQHVLPQLEVGKVGFISGQYMASADEITMTVTGKGGHAAMPHLNIDTVMVTAQILVALQQIVSRYANPTIPTVLSFGKIAAEGAFNIIPNEVVAWGTFRTMNETWREQAHQQMKKMAETMAQSMGASCQFFINKGYPVLYNDPKLTENARQCAKDFLGSSNVVQLDKWLAAEDFAYYSQKIPACFYRLGVRNTAKNITASVHTPTFDADEKALEIGMGLMSYIALEELKR